MQIMTPFWVESRFTFGCGEVLCHKFVWRAGRAFSCFNVCCYIGISAMMNLNTYLRSIANVRHDSETPSEGYN